MLPLTRNANDQTTGVRCYRAGWTLVAHGTPWYIAINVLGGMLLEGARQLAKGKRPVLAEGRLPTHCRRCSKDY